jgi:hypothetical protein
LLGGRKQVAGPLLKKRCAQSNKEHCFFMKATVKWRCISLDHWNLNAHIWSRWSYVRDIFYCTGVGSLARSWFSIKITPQCIVPGPIPALNASNRLRHTHTHTHCGCS